MIVYVTTKFSMSVIVSLIPHAARLQRLRAAARDAHVVMPCDGWDELFAVCTNHLVHLAILDLEAIGAPNFDPVRQLKRLTPRTALIAYVTLTPDRIHHVFDAGRYGFDGLVVTDLDDGPTAFAKTLERAGARGVAMLIRSSVPHNGSPIARDALMVAVTRAHERLTPASLARILSLPPRQLARELACAKYPSPHRLITWGRLIVAAESLDDPRHSAERVALTLQFPSGSAFRNTLQRYLGATPTELRDRGGALYAIDSLRALIKQGSADHI